MSNESVHGKITKNGKLKRQLPLFLEVIYELAWQNDHLGDLKFPDSEDLEFSGEFSNLT